MCEAVTTMTAAQMFWSSMAMTVASTAVSYAAQSEQASQTRDYQGKVAEEQNRILVATQQAANKEFVEGSAAQNLQLAQKEQSYSQDAQNVQAQREQRVGTALASSENAGLSLDALLGGFYRNEAQYKAGLAQQFGFDRVQRDINVESLQDKAENRTSSVGRYIPSPVSRPNPFGAALQIGTGAFTNYYAWSDTKPDPNDPTKKIRRLGG
ncbi:virion core protein, T7 gp14 family [Humidesulfovibrio sp.]